MCRVTNLGIYPGKDAIGEFLLTRMSPDGKTLARKGEGPRSTATSKPTQAASRKGCDS